MLQKLLWLPLTLLLLSSCETAADKASGFVGVPLPPLSKEDQTAAYHKIVQACGQPPACKREDVLERMALDYVKLRTLSKAAGGAP